MADFSGICDSHGLLVFNADDSQAPEGLAVGWYWATLQHLVLTGNPAGPYRTRRGASAAMAAAILEHDVD